MSKIDRTEVELVDVVQQIMKANSFRYEKKTCLKLNTDKAFNGRRNHTWINVTGATKEMSISILSVIMCSAVMRINSAYRVSCCFNPKNVSLKLHYIS
jgi:hypothetical protein